MREALEGDELAYILLVSVSMSAVVSSALSTECQKVPSSETCRGYMRC